jgi:hypothetical protein
MIGPMIVNIHQHHTTVLHEPLLGHRFICGGDHLQLTKVPGVDPSAGGGSSPILQEKVDTLGTHFTFRHSKKRETMFFFPQGHDVGDEHETWNFQMEYP